MKNTTKPNGTANRPHFTSSNRRVSQKPIKIIKDKQNLTNTNFSSSILQPMNKNNTKMTLKENTSESRDKNILFSSSSTRLPPKSNQSQTNWYEKTNRNPFKISRNNESIGLDIEMSQSFSKVPSIHKTEKKKISMSNENPKLPFQSIKTHNYNNKKKYRDKDKNDSHNHINVFHKRNLMRDNLNMNNNILKQNNDTSTFLNYELGNTNNYTQIDELFLDNNNNTNDPPVNPNDLLTITHVHPSSSNHSLHSLKDKSNEMEINLSGASIVFDSFIQCTRIKDMIKIRHDKINQAKNSPYLKNIFSNNSVYYLDTNEFIEGERKNEIYSSTTKENISPFKPQYCLTDFNVPSMKTQPKQDRNSKINMTKPIAKTSNSFPNTFYRKVPLNHQIDNGNSNKIRNHFRDSINNYK